MNKKFNNKHIDHNLYELCKCDTKSYGIKVDFFKENGLTYMTTIYNYPLYKKYDHLFEK